RRRAGGHQRDRGPRTTVRRRCARPDGRAMTAPGQPMRPSEIVDVFLVAAVGSGDGVGGALVRARRGRAAGRVWVGVCRGRGRGGRREMGGEGIAGLYPSEDLASIGSSAIPRRSPKIGRRMRCTAKAVVTQRPRVLVIIDSPGFTRGIARRVRAADPTIAI